MRQEDYVSYDVAKLLNEKGYDEKCSAIWEVGISGEKNPRLAITLGIYKKDNLMRTSDWSKQYEYLAPGLYDVQKWLREKHSVIVDIDTDYYDGFIFTSQVWSLGRISEKQSFDTYEQALNEGIKEALKMI